MKNIVLLVFVSALFASPVLAQGPSSKDVKISKFKVRGSGCPKGSYTKIVTNSLPDNPSIDYFQVTYKDFGAKSGEEAPEEKISQTCSLSFNLDYPEGYQIVFENLEFYGFARLVNSGVAMFQASLSLPLQDPVKYTSYLHGPMDSDFSYLTRRKLQEFKTGCEGKARVRIQSFISIVSDPELENEILVDSNNGLVGQSIQYRFEKCD